ASYGHWFLPRPPGARAGRLRDTRPAGSVRITDQAAVNMALEWVRPGEVSGLAIAMYCRPEGASNAEVLAACRDEKTNRARALHLKRKLDFMKAWMEDGTLRYFVGPGREPPPDHQMRSPSLGGHKIIRRTHLKTETKTGPPMEIVGK